MLCYVTEEAAEDVSGSKSEKGTAEDTARVELETVLHGVEVGSRTVKATIVGTHPHLAACREVRARRKLPRSGMRRAAERDTGVESAEGWARSAGGRRESSVAADAVAAEAAGSEWAREVLQLEDNLAVGHILVSGEILSQEMYAAGAAAPVAHSTGHLADSPLHYNISPEHRFYRLHFKLSSPSHLVVPSLLDLVRRCALYGVTWSPLSRQSF